MSVSNRSDENNFFNTEQTPFPEVMNGKIDTSQFLESSKGVVCLVDKFGKVFTPVKYDMTGNIEKLHQRYSIDQERHKYLNDMILIEKEEGGSYAIDGLLWLRRALQFIHAFFTCIIDDSQQVEKTDDLSPFLKKAYKETLEPYHGWMAQRLFGLLSRLCPSRKELLLTLALGQEINEEAILHDMGHFLVSLEANLQVILKLYLENGLESSKKV